MTEIQVRLVEERDIPAICAIVNHYIEHTVINLRENRQTPAQWHEQWSAGRERFPWLVADVGGAVLGVAYAGAYNPREAYAWTAESTIYLKHGAEGQGIGKILYGRLFELLDAQGFVSVTAGVTLPNPGSEGIHASFGFVPTGRIASAGFKFGQWWDVGHFQRIGAVPSTPVPLKPVAAVL